MFARHASLTRRHTRDSIQVLRLTRQAAREVRFPSACAQIYRFQSSSSSAVDAMDNNPKVKFSAGADETSLAAALQELLSSPGKGGRWTLIPNGQGLERSFKFRNFTKTWDFMTAVALQCKLKNHHPEWSNVYNTTYIRWTTHSPAGLSAKDVELADICDSLARDFGEVNDGGYTAESSVLREAADRVVGDAGDCCVPKTKKT
ncbi:pterin 4 alpha carbinolamine dehydratase-domain-containing protein [Hypoxylon argillaceum]|nr:pterin 4 alpha carbinolamine dehydratase-domain-containing protein [Hypoxylon argillaceum]KAI1151971.1 pterin 4 alpha carbinolamine dehydratase-domain-containing protein [Nemania diffusa]